MSDNVVRRWFGEDFSQLHPRLQALHLTGGILRGDVEPRTGTGIAGLIGRRIAASMGLPLDRRRRGLEVVIDHDANGLLWSRRFDGGAVMTSTFVPVGTRACGYWVETTGALRLHLGVDTAGGGWQWKPLRAYVHSMRVPLWTLPRLRAGKRIVGDRYLFSVELSVPIIGEVLGYRGELAMVDPSSRAKQ